MVNRVGAFLTLAALLSGGTIAPALDASAEHRAEAARSAPRAVLFVDVASAHDLTNCALVLAATVSTSLPGCAFGVSRVLELESRLGAFESNPGTSSAPFLLPSSRAPPRS